MGLHYEALLNFNRVAALNQIVVISMKVDIDLDLLFPLFSFAHC
jgi:hypothetical protein